MIRMIRRMITMVHCCGRQIPSDGIVAHRRMAKEHGGVAQSRAADTNRQGAGLESRHRLAPVEPSPAAVEAACIADDERLSMERVRWMLRAAYRVDGVTPEEQP